ncbi:hypothetical protein I550_1561 [Mycobacterium intracellulare 1956]|uniref:Uncharacterized protein n=1 Tax=Mycobacterium intracellulare 1956 TaxID=1299331 RepID=X8CSI7_MYCIT|nr:hypothetical protein I550_1561 [Mycobacterium intracellulare 1956]
MDSRTSFCISDIGGRRSWIAFVVSGDIKHTVAMGDGLRS